MHNLAISQVSQREGKKHMATKSRILNMIVQIINVHIQSRQILVFLFASHMSCRCHQEMILE